MVAILLGVGDMVDSPRRTAMVTVGPISAKYRLTPAVHPLVHRVCETYRPRYAIVNSIESREVLTPFDQAGVATVLLVHEFAYIRPLGDLHAAIEKATEVVYSARPRLGQRCPPVSIPGITARAHRTAGPGPDPEKPVRRR